MNKAKLVAHNHNISSRPGPVALGKSLKGPVISTPRVVKLATNKSSKANDRKVHAWTKYAKKIELKRNKDSLAQVIVDSISRDGLMFYCDLDTVVLLLGNSLCTTPQHSCMVDLQLPIYSKNRTQKLNLCCKINSSRRLSRDRFQLVMRFTGLKPNQNNILEGFFKEQGNNP